MTEFSKNIFFMKLFKTFMFIAEISYSQNYFFIIAFTYSHGKESIQFLQSGKLKKVKEFQNYLKVGEFFKIFKSV